MPRKLFKGGLYSRAETIWGNTVNKILKTLENSDISIATECIFYEAEADTFLPDLKYLLYAICLIWFSFYSFLKIWKVARLCLHEFVKFEYLPKWFENEAEKAVAMIPDSYIYIVGNFKQNMLTLFKPLNVSICIWEIGS